MRDTNEKRIIREHTKNRRINKAKTDPILVSSTLTIGRQEENYFLDNTQVVMLSKVRNMPIDDTVKFNYKIYLETIKSLIYNVNLILSLQNFNTCDKNGKLIDAKYLKSSNYLYPQELKSIFSHTKKIKTITSDAYLAEKLIQVLEESQRIIENTEKVIVTPLLIENPSLQSTFDHTKEIKNKYIATSNLIITALKNEKINLGEFKSNICFKEKFSSFTLK